MRELGILKKQRQYAWKSCYLNPLLFFLRVLVQKGELGGHFLLLSLALLQLCCALGLPLLVFLPRTKKVFRPSKWREDTSTKLASLRHANCKKPRTLHEKVFMCGGMCTVEHVLR